MKHLSKWAGALVAIVVLAGASAAADAVAAGKVKAIDADKKEVVLTAADGKDATFKLDKNVVVNRAGKETPNGLQVGDAVNVCYDKGLVTWTAHYFLVQEGDSKKFWLVHGALTSYDAAKNELVLTDSNGATLTCSTGTAKVRLNKADAKLENIKIGDKCLALLEPMGDKAILKSLIVERK
jgi:Cu/Ag efflux protein CusF